MQMDPMPYRPPVPRRPDLGSRTLPPPPLPDFDEPPERPRRSRGFIASVVITLLLLVTASAAGFAPLFEEGGSNRAARSPEGDYNFILTRGSADRPVRWNPCEEIHYVIGAGTPPESVETVHGAVREVSRLTGVKFVFDGTSTEVSSELRQAYQPARYPDRWAPVLIDWVDPADSDVDFTDDEDEAAAVASPLVAYGGNGGVYVSGWIVMSSADPNPPGFATFSSEGPVLLHELGHVLGLSHAESYGNLMEPSGGGVGTFGPGDLEGLSYLGRGAGCLETPEPR
jgi:hypothetical protein